MSDRYIDDAIRTLNDLDATNLSEAIKRLCERLTEAESIITGLYVVPECRAYYDKYIKEKRP